MIEWGFKAEPSSKNGRVPDLSDSTRCHQGIYRSRAAPAALRGQKERHRALISQIPAQPAAPVPFRISVLASSGDLDLLQAPSSSMAVQGDRVQPRHIAHEIEDEDHEQVGPNSQEIVILTRRRDDGTGSLTREEQVAGILATIKQPRRTGAHGHGDPGTFEPLVTAFASLPSSLWAA